MTFKNLDRWKWVGLIVGLLLFSVGTQTILIVSAVSSPSFAVVPDYEARARDWDTEQRQASVNKHLDWTLDLTVERSAGDEPSRIDLSVFDTYGKPVREAAVELRAFHLARSNRIVLFRPLAIGDGFYSARAHLEPAGLWEFQVVVDRGRERFTQKIRKSLGR